jgi:hypothetical protein
MAAGYGNRAGAACGGLPVSVAFDHDANDDRVLRRSRKRDPPSPSLSWVGLVLHIFGQIAIWLSLFVMSLAIVLLMIPRG